MATQTPNKYLQEPSNGSANWDTPLNANFTAIDQALGSTFPIYVADGSSTIALAGQPTPSPAAVSGVNWYDAQQWTINSGASGSPVALTANVIITLPSTIGSGSFGGAWIVGNNISPANQGAFTVTIKGASGSGVTISNSSSAFIYFDGTNVYYADSNALSGGNPKFGTLTSTSTTYLSTTSGKSSVGMQAPTTATITIASPAVVTLPAGAAPLPNTAVSFATTGALPTGVTAATTYYVTNPTGATFNLAATQGGSAINTSGTQSGIHTATFVAQTELDIMPNNILGTLVPSIVEPTTLSTTGSTGTINFDLVSQSVIYNTANATANWTLNFRGNSSTTLASILNVGQSVTAAYLNTNGAAPTQSVTWSHTSNTITFTNSSANITQATGTLPAVNAQVQFTTTGSLATNFSTGTPYYVVSSSGTIFTVSATVGGTAIVAGSAGSGTNTVNLAGVATVTTAPPSGAIVSFSGATLPTGITAGTSYYALNLSTTTFNVAATLGGTAIAIATNGSGSITGTFPPYYNAAVQIDGTSYTPVWQGSAAPTTGSASAIDAYSYTIIKTAATPTYKVLASKSTFA